MSFVVDLTIPHMSYILGWLQAFFSNTLRFPVATHLLFYSETVIRVPADCSMFLNVPPWDFSFSSAAASQNLLKLSLPY